MRILLIDNHDSFTHNLAHYLERVTGRMPDVRTNDDPELSAATIGGYDAIVLSPGPGSPEVPRDFGHCQTALLQEHVPLLGVCLGHQGLCLHHGARIQRASPPMHGRRSDVFHDGSELFLGLPSPLSVVRYHSLIAQDVPLPLRVTAQTVEGLVMAVAHRDLPHFGVQFHPESIRTEHGLQLLENFIALSRRAAGVRITARADESGARAQRHAGQATRVPVGEGPGSTPRELGLDSPLQVPLELHTRRLSRWVDPAVVFAKLYRDSEYAFWLDSSLHHPAPLGGERSIMGDARGPLARVLLGSVASGRLRLRTAAGIEELPGPILAHLERDLKVQQQRLWPRRPEEAGHVLGWIGYLGYELKAECGAAAAHESHHPDAGLIFADRALCFDHQSHTITAHCLAERDQPELASDYFEELEDRLWGQCAAASLEGHASETGTGTPAPQPLRFRHDQAAYLELIKLCQRAIAAGESYEVCLTNTIEGRCEEDPLDVYLRLRAASPAPFGSFLRLGSLSVLGCSPERFLHISPTGQMETRPIKGTRRRDPEPDRDRELARELQEDEKEQAENLMIVDLCRNDLARCAVPGSVHVSALFEVESYATVHQLVSTVRAQLRPDCSPLQALAAAFPGGSMTGAPKLRTMELLDALEGGPRGIYSGTLGRLGLSGELDLAMVIRSVVIDDGQFSIGSGGAITALSSPEAEWEEMLLKARRLLEIIAPEIITPGTRTPPASG